MNIVDILNGLLTSMGALLIVAFVMLTFGYFAPLFFRVLCYVNNKGEQHADKIMPKKKRSEAHFDCDMCD